MACQQLITDRWHGPAMVDQPTGGHVHAFADGSGLTAQARVQHFKSPCCADGKNTAGTNQTPMSSTHSHAQHRHRFDVRSHTGHPHTCVCVGCRCAFPTHLLHPRTLKELHHQGEAWQDPGPLSHTCTDGMYKQYELSTRGSQHTRVSCAGCARSCRLVCCLPKP